MSWMIVRMENRIAYRSFWYLLVSLGEVFTNLLQG